MYSLISFCISKRVLLHSSFATKKDSYAVLTLTLEMLVSLEESIFSLGEKIFGQIVNASIKRAAITKMPTPENIFRISPFNNIKTLLIFSPFIKV